MGTRGSFGCQDEETSSQAIQVRGNPGFRSCSTGSIQSRECRLGLVAFFGETVQTLTQTKSAQGQCFLGRLENTHFRIASSPLLRDCIIGGLNEHGSASRDSEAEDTTACFCLFGCLLRQLRLSRKRRRPPNFWNSCWSSDEGKSKFEMSRVWHR